ncbi:MAG: nicotinate (nicotinamide) nucleotide adenylyltransferase [Phycisphaerae bacterium]|nr:nicotinate (nicotinamide) nucleotide adenylyltransferase [Phycisphaerae bacterium]
MEKIILFGGTFDPVHNGHIAVSLAAVEKIGASKVILIPARRSPHKHQKPLAMDNDRMAMLKLAVAGNALFEISPIELNRGEPSYTIDTVRQLKQKFGKACEFYWLLGVDMLGDLPKWYKAEELLSECNFSVMNRGGFEKPDFSFMTGKLSPEAIDKLRKNQIQTPLIDISSTEIRRRIVDGQDISEIVSAAVLSYIQKHKLYTLGHQLSGNDEF